MHRAGQKSNALSVPQFHFVIGLFVILRATMMTLYDMDMSSILGDTLTTGLRIRVTFTCVWSCVRLYLETSLFTPLRGSRRPHACDR